jgi:hypothetical protein
MDRTRTMFGLVASTWILAAAPATATQEVAAGADNRFEYKLLATNKTSTMEKELNEAAEAGFRFEGVMGGQTGFGGKEVVSILSRPMGTPSTSTYEYKLCATTKTSTMQKEVAEAAEAGYQYRGQTVTDTMFGGQEVVVIMERLRGDKVAHFEYKLLATNKTSTMQKELAEAGEAGFVFKGITVGNTSFGGREVVLITHRPLSR